MRAAQTIINNTLAATKAIKCAGNHAGNRSHKQRAIQLATPAVQPPSGHKAPERKKHSDCPARARDLSA